MSMRYDATSLLEINILFKYKIFFIRNEDKSKP